MKKLFGNRRRNYFIKRKFQLMLILKFTGIFLICNALFFAFLYYISLESSIFVFQDLSLKAQPTVSFVLPYLIGGWIISIILGIISTTIVMLISSHKIAGALFRIEKSCNALAKGHFDFHIQIRKDDECQDLVTHFNLMVHYLRTKIGEVKRSSRTLKKHIETIPEQQDESKETATSQELKQHIAALENQLNYFRL